MGKRYISRDGRFPIVLSIRTIFILLTFGTSDLSNLITLHLLLDFPHRIHHNLVGSSNHISFTMSTSTHTPSESPRKSSTPSRHRRSTGSLHSKPGLGLIRTISRDLVTGWHTHTALQKEPFLPQFSGAASQVYKPRYAARDAMRSFEPTLSCDTNSEKLSKPPSERSRQDYVLPSPIEIDGPKPLACVEEGLIPDHSSDTWTAVWDDAYEQRIDAYNCFPCPLSQESRLTRNALISASPMTSAEKRERRKSSRGSRSPLSSSFSVTDAEVRAFVFGNRRTGGHESPEAVLRPESSRRRSEVPSLVPSLVSSESSGLEDLDEEEEGVEEVETPKKEIGKGGNCVCCSKCGACASARVQGR